MVDDGDVTNMFQGDAGGRFERFIFKTISEKLRKSSVGASTWEDKLRSFAEFLGFLLEKRGTVLAGLAFDKDSVDEVVAGTKEMVQVARKYKERQASLRAKRASVKISPKRSEDDLRAEFGQAVTEWTVTGT